VRFSGAHALDDEDSRFALLLHRALVPESYEVPVRVGELRAVAPVGALRRMSGGDARGRELAVRGIDVSNLEGERDASRVNETFRLLDEDREVVLVLERSRAALGDLDSLVVTGSLSKMATPCERLATEEILVSGLKIVLRDPKAEDVRYIEDRLYEFNVEATGIADGEGLGLFVRNERNEIVAGVAGHTWGGTCELRQVWVQPALRGRGLGRQLIEAAIREAERRGCVQMVLGTHSFQAPGFYQKLGFKEVARLDHYPRGHAQLFFRKDLRPEQNPVPAGLQKERRR